MKKPEKICWILTIASVFFFILHGAGAEERIGQEQSIQTVRGGYDPHITEYRFQVSVYLRNGKCSGALIAPDVVITAAHCVVNNHGVLDNPRHIEVCRGWPHEYECVGGMDKLIVHPEYNYVGAGFNNDVALIWMGREFAISPEPVKLVGTELEDNYYSSGVMGAVVGHGGATAQLKFHYGYLQIAGKNLTSSMKNI